MILIFGGSAYASSAVFGEKNGFWFGTEIAIEIYVRDQVADQCT